MQPNNGKHVAEVLAAYPRATFASAREALVAMTTDERFTCPARRIARAALRGGRAKPYRVVFALGHDHDGYRPYGAYHGVDLNYAFGVLDTPKQPATPFEREASARWMDAIGAFAATGRPPFRPYDASGVVTVFGREAQAEPDHAAARCDVWDAVPTLH